MAHDGPTAAERFINGILPENPVYRQMLGLCPVLAVTAATKPAATMAAAVLFVLIGANVIVSSIRRQLKPHLRLLIFLLIIATLVTVADRVLKSSFPGMSRALGPYVPLIIVNCIILSRCEVCASRQNLKAAAADAVGMSLGFAWALLSIATVREILARGTWFGLEVMPLTSGDYGWAVIGQPAGSFFVMGLLFALHRWLGAMLSRVRNLGARVSEAGDGRGGVTR
jgi:electron transport complex protein RnfE